MSDVSRDAACAPVRAMISEGTSSTSAASRAAVSVSMCCPVGTRTFPPGAAPAAAGPQAHAGRARLDHRLHQLEASGQRRAGLGAATTGASPRRRPGLRPPGACPAPPASRAGRWTATPARPPLASAHDRAERRQRVLAVQEVPQAAGTAPGKVVLPRDAAAQPDHVLRAVVTRDARPAGVGLPLPLQQRRLLAVRAHGDHAFPVTSAVLRRLAVYPCCGAIARSDVLLPGEFFIFFPW